MWAWFTVLIIQWLSGHTSLTKIVLRSAALPAACSILMHEAQSKYLVFLLCSGPKHNPPPLSISCPHHICPQPPRCFISVPYPAYVKSCSVPGCSASNQLFTFQKLTSEIVLRAFPIGALSAETHLMPEIRLLDQNRKKGLCCHFHFCITQPAVMVFVCLVLCSLRFSSG